MSDLLQALSSEFALNMEDVLYLIRSAPYRYKVYKIPKRESNKMRIIAQPARELKPLQYWVMKNVLSVFPIHPAATAYRKGGNIADNARPHVSHRFLCKMDFKNFFPSIKARDFVNFISNSHLGERWTREETEYLARILFWRDKRGGELKLSIGAPSSPLLSNIILYRFDSELDEFCLDRGVQYTRYADDLTFSTNEEKVLYLIEQEIPKICKRLESPRLLVNRSKTVHASKRGVRRVTGLVLTNDGLVSIGRNKKREVRASLHRFVLGKLDAEETVKLAGTVAYIKSVEPGYVQSLVRKYGSGALERLFSIDRTSEV